MFRVHAAQVAYLTKNDVQFKVNLPAGYISFVKSSQ